MDKQKKNYRNTEQTARWERGRGMGEKGEKKYS